MLAQSDPIKRRTLYNFFTLSRTWDIERYKGFLADM